MLAHFCISICIHTGGFNRARELSPRTVQCFSFSAPHVFRLVSKDYTGFSRGSRSCGTLPRHFPIGSELRTLEIERYGTFFEQAPWKFHLDLSNKSAREGSVSFLPHFDGFDVSVGFLFTV